jgi:hypothetical protein
LDDLTLIDNQVFIYPRIIRPILQSCDFVHRVNSFLSLTVHGCVRTLGPGLPQVFIVRIPKVLFVYSTVDLVATGDPRVANLLTLTPGGHFNPQTANGDLISLLTSYINDGVGETMAHQKTLGWWKKYLIGRDMRQHPNKMCYQAANWDRQLTEWQQANCH